MLCGVRLAAPASSMNSSHQHAEQALIIREQIENPNATKVRAQLAAWQQNKYVRLARFSENVVGNNDRPRAQI